MSGNTSATLLASMLGLLAAQQLAPEALDPWRGWLAFKQFVRSVPEVVDPGVSVQVAPEGDRQPLHLFFVRQVVEERFGCLEPVGGLVCELVFAPRRRTPLAWSEWSFEFERLEDFVDAVERTPLFADLIATVPLHTAVYWEEA